MGKMGYSVSGTAEGGEQFQYGISYHKILGTDGYGQGEDEHTLVRECHSEGEQDTIYGTRGTYGGPAVQEIRHRDDGSVERYGIIGIQSLNPIVGKLHHLLHQSGSQAAGEIVEEEALAAHGILHDATEHPYGKHIEEQMRETAVHKHIGKELVEIEVAGHKEVQAEHVIQVNTIGRKGGSPSGSEEQHIDNEQVLGYRRHIVHNSEFLYCGRKITKIKQERTYKRPHKWYFFVFYYIFLQKNLGSTAIIHIFVIKFTDINLFINIKKHKVMNKTELIAKIAEGAGLSKVDAKKALEATLDAITGAVKAGDKVALIGFGTFSVSERAARKGINVLTKKTINIPAKKVVKFKAGADLKF